VSVRQVADDGVSKIDKFLHKKHLHITSYIKSHKMKTNWCFVVLFLFILVSCKKEQESAPFGLNQELTLKAGDICNSKSDNLSVKVLKINDSRCPIGVVCVWQGEATVNLEVKEASVYEVVLSTFHQPVDTVNNLIFKLVDVQPYPKYGVEVPDSEKCVVLKIDRLK
jgi:hypothetical protein